MLSQLAGNGTLVSEGTLVVVAKCPRLGSSKTRLIPLLGSEGACKFAYALLSDTLVTLSSHPQLSTVLKILLYAPGDNSGRQQMVDLFETLKIKYHDEPMDHDSIQVHTDMTSNTLSPAWYLMPMVDSELNRSSPLSLTTSDLGKKLANALERTRILVQALKGHNTEAGPILFLGMDSPELPVDEIVSALNVCHGNTNRAYMCPADDGGYGFICVPSKAPSRIFTSGVRWSTPLAAVSQIKACTDENIDVKLGTFMYDIDEPEDVHRFVDRWISSPTVTDTSSTDTGMMQTIGRVCKNTSSSSEETLDGCPLSISAQCSHTITILIELGIMSGRKMLHRKNR